MVEMREKEIRQGGKSREGRRNRGADTHEQARQTWFECSSLPI